MSVYETDLPGVGKKFELELESGGRLVVVIHHSGRREVFHREEPEDDGVKLFELGDREARQLGLILEGTFFQPVATLPVETMLGSDAILDWVNVPEGSPLAGRSLGASELRHRTGASVLAVKRDAGTTPNPDAGFELAAGDVLVVLGGREEVQAVEALAAGDA